MTNQKTFYATLVALFIFASFPFLKHLLPILNHAWAPTLFFAFSVCVIMATQHISPKSIGLHAKGFLKNVVLGLALGLLGLILFYFLQKVIINEKILVQRMGLEPMGLSWVLPVLAVPLCEEVFFRGLLLSSLKSKFPLAKSIFISAILFTLVHSQNYLGAFTLGLAGAIITQKTKSLIPTIVLHMCGNAYPLI